jgi:hypothetical protein
VVSTDLPGGLRAVKVTLRNPSGKQLYGVYDSDNRYCGELLTLQEVAGRKERKPQPDGSDEDLRGAIYRPGSEGPIVT